MFDRPNNLWSGTPTWADKDAPIITQLPNGPFATDIVVIGAGITGALAASALAEAGYDVTIVDQKAPLQGSIRASTALLQYDLDQPLLRLKESIGCDNAIRAWQRSRLALESLHSKIERLQIDCDMALRPSLSLAGNLLSSQEMDAEILLRRAAGLYCSKLSATALAAEYGLTRDGAIHCLGNFTADPIKLTRGFLLHAQSLGAQVIAPITVQDVQAGEEVIVKTEQFDISCRYVVYATGYHVEPSLLPTGSELVATYVMVTRPQPENLWKDDCLIAEASSPYLYLRTTADGRIMCGGEDEPWQGKAQCDALLGKKTAILQDKLAMMFPAVDAFPETSWCGAFGNSQTGLPTIGAIPNKPGCFGIFAFGGNGITFAALAADMITAQIAGIPCADDDLFAYR